MTTRTSGSGSSTTARFGGRPASAQTARARLTQARLTRSEYLMSVAEGLLEPDDVVAASLDAKNKGLRLIGLRDLHATAGGRPFSRISRLMSAALGTMSNAAPPDSQTVGWLIDHRLGGRRYLAWTDACRAERNAPPWDGFPSRLEPKNAG